MDNLNDKAFEYLKGWIQTDRWDDLAIMYDRGDLDLLAYTVYSAGAIDHTACDKEYSKIEHYIEKIAKKFEKLSHKKQRKQYDETFKGVFTVQCLDCNHNSFLADGNEELYPEVKEKCWECSSNKIETSIWE